MAAGDIRKKFAAQKTPRASQAIFGERQHLAEVLRSVRAAKLPSARQQREVRTLDRFIAERTRELNRITPGWDRKFKKSRDPRTSSRELLRLAAALSSEDYLLARVLTEHAEAPPELLESMASHPYSSVRENPRDRRWRRHAGTRKPLSASCATWRRARTSRFGSLWLAIHPRPPTCATASARA